MHGDLKRVVSPSNLGVGVGVAVAEAMLIENPHEKFAEESYCQATHRTTHLLRSPTHQLHRKRCAGET